MAARLWELGPDQPGTNRAFTTGLGLMDEGVGDAAFLDVAVTAFALADSEVPTTS
jgi:hypothetical protein